MSSQASDPAEFLPRRRPSQERSRRRFDDILRAARALLVEVGFESFTSEQVALRAGVPIGSLYQFFGNKYAIICELDRLDTANVQTALAEFAAEIPTLAWGDLLEKLLEPVEAGDLARELLQLGLHVDGVEPVELADDGVLVAEELVQRADGYAGPQRHLLGGERLEAHLHQQRPRRAQDVIEASTAPLLRRPPPREELPGVARRCAHAPRLLEGRRGKPM